MLIKELDQHIKENVRRRERERRAFKEEQRIAGKLASEEDRRIRDRDRRKIIERNKDWKDALDHQIEEKKNIRLYRSSGGLTGEERALNKSLLADLKGSEAGSFMYSKGSPL